MRCCGLPVRFFLGTALLLLIGAVAWFGVAADGGAAEPLTDPETRFQGSWKDRSGWVLTFDGKDFSANSGDSWYTGSFVAPATDKRPAPLDIVIDDCNCNYKGMTSRSIYEWNDDGLLLSGGTPGKSRPPIFDDTLGLILEMQRLDPPAGD